MYLANYGGINIGSLTIIRSPSYAFYWITGFDHNYARLRSQNLLVWNAIKNLKEKEVPYLDFGGGSLYIPGIRKWKSDWGTDLRKTYLLCKDR